MQSLLREYIRKQIIELLYEGRLEDAKKKYAGKIDDQTFQLITANDPSGNQKYLDWACREISSGASAEDVIPTFNEWERIGKNLPEKDITKLTAKQAEDALKAYDAKLSGKRKQKYGSVAGAAVIGETSKYIVYRIETHSASRELGTGTKWCITMSTAKYWNSYIEGGSKFHFFIPKKSGIDKIACMSVGSEQQVAYTPDDKYHLPGAIGVTQECEIAWKDCIAQAKKSFDKDGVTKENIKWAAAAKNNRDLATKLLGAMNEKWVSLLDCAGIASSLPHDIAKQFVESADTDPKLLIGLGAIFPNESAKNPNFEKIYNSYEMFKIWYETTRNSLERSGKVFDPELENLILSKGNVPYVTYGGFRINDSVANRINKLAPDAVLQSDDDTIEKIANANLPDSVWVTLLTDSTYLWKKILPFLLEHRLAGHECVSQWLSTFTKSQLKNLLVDLNVVNDTEFLKKWSPFIRKIAMEKFNSSKDLGQKKQLGKRW